MDRKKGKDRAVVRQGTCLGRSGGGGEIRILRQWRRTGVEPHRDGEPQDGRNVSPGTAGSRRFTTIGPRRSTSYENTCSPGPQHWKRAAHHRRCATRSKCSPFPGRTIGLIVLPAHPLRVAWQAAYDNLVLHTAFEHGQNPKDVRDEFRGLDGAMFPAFLPNPGGGSFVFADTLGFHAVGMVPDSDKEPKAALAILARALGESETADTAPTVGGQSAAVLGDEIVKYLDCHEASRLLPRSRASRWRWLDRRQIARPRPRPTLPRR